MALFTFLNSWWIAMFFVLPFSREYAKESDGIPAKIHWKRAIIGSTLLAIAITGLIAILVKETHL